MQTNVERDICRALGLPLESGLNQHVHIYIYIYIYISAQDIHHAVVTIKDKTERRGRSSAGFLGL